MSSWREEAVGAEGGLVGAGGTWVIPSAVAMDLSRGRLLREGNCGHLPPPERGAPSWPLLPLRSQAVFSSECSIEQIAARWKKGGKQEEMMGVGHWERSRNKILVAN